MTSAKRCAKNIFNRSVCYFRNVVKREKFLRQEIQDASHCDLYDGGFTEPAGKGEPKNMIPWDKLAEFFEKNLK